MLKWSVGFSTFFAKSNLIGLAYFGWSHRWQETRWRMASTCTLQQGSSSISNRKNCILRDQISLYNEDAAEIHYYSYSQLAYRDSSISIDHIILRDADCMTLLQLLKLAIADHVTRIKQKWIVSLTTHRKFAIYMQMSDGCRTD